MKNGFSSESYPFPEWLGPYSPTRGNKRGLRIRNNELGMFFTDETQECFYPAKVTDGISALVNLVTQHYHGGRVLFLPNGLVIKPLQEQDDRCRRVVIGQYFGDIDITLSRDYSFSTERLKTMNPGEMLTNSCPPTSLGLECVIQSNGSLKTKWYDQSGLETNIEITNSNHDLINGFRKARPGDDGGRVHVIIGGCVLTNKQLNSEWHPCYVGRIELTNFQDWHNRWSEKNNLQNHH